MTTWERDRLAVAERVGGIERADALLAALPYSTIPGWDDCQDVLDLIASWESTP